MLLDLKILILKLLFFLIQYKKRLTRRFIVTEGLFANFGDIAPLDRLVIIKSPRYTVSNANILQQVELKKKFKYRLILDESQSIGVLGRKGAGLTDLYNIDVSLNDLLVFKNPYSFFVG
jgi:serine palmitoyltransferase